MANNALYASLTLASKLKEIDLDSEDADSIRDEMKKYWDQLSDSEQTFVQKVISEVEQKSREHIIVTPLKELKPAMNSEGIGSFPIHRVPVVRISKKALDAMTEAEDKLEESFEKQIEEDKRASKFIRED